MLTGLSKESAAGYRTSLRVGDSSFYTKKTSAVLEYYRWYFGKSTYVTPLGVAGCRRSAS